MSIEPPAQIEPAPAGRNGRTCLLVAAHGFDVARTFRPTGAWSFRTSPNYNHCIPPGLTLGTLRFDMQFSETKFVWV